MEKGGRKRIKGIGVDSKGLWDDDIRRWRRGCRSESMMEGIKIYRCLILSGYQYSCQKKSGYQYHHQVSPHSTTAALNRFAFTLTASHTVPFLIYRRGTSKKRYLALISFQCPKVRFFSLGWIMTIES